MQRSNEPKDDVAMDAGKYKMVVRRLFKVTLSLSLLMNISTNSCKDNKNRIKKLGGSASKCQFHFSSID